MGAFFFTDDALGPVAETIRVSDAVLGPVAESLASWPRKRALARCIQTSARVSAHRSMQTPLHAGLYFQYVYVVACLHVVRTCMAGDKGCDEHARGLNVGCTCHALACYEPPLAAHT